MSTTAKEPTELARLTKAVDSLAGVKMELAALEAASRAAEGPEEVEGINHIVHRNYWEMVETLEIVAGVQKRLREREDWVGLELDEDGVREIVLDLYRVGWAATQDKDSDKEELERRLDAINRLANVTADRLCEAAGIPIHDRTTDEFLEATRAFGEKAAEVGRAAVLDPDRLPKRFQASDRPRRREEVGS